MSKNRNNSRGVREDRDGGDDERLANKEPLLPVVDDEGLEDDERVGASRGALEPLIDERDGQMNTGERPDFSQDEGRDDHDRLMFDREHEEREYTEEERLELFRLTLFQNQLPILPKIPGYHICWLTTTNPRDPIHGRIRLGYKLVQCAEIPGFEHSAIKEGPYAGCIGVNEMVAAKLPNRLYSLYMNEAHHVQPLQEEQRLRSNVDDLQEKAEESKSRLLEEPGMKALGKSRRPRFEGLSG